MSKISAGLLMYRRRTGNLEVFLVHPGGPFFRKKDDGAWTVPKGEVDFNEDFVAAARREFQEETGLTPTGPLMALSPIKQKSGKTVYVWAFEGDCDPATIVSNDFAIEWPPHSGKMQSFPEIDRAAFFDLATAAVKINPAQAPLLDELASRLTAVD
jgi:predicted NUDIX family NTP pyrophosphohydrolase